MPFFLHDQVLARVDIGGFRRQRVPRGTPGVVVVGGSTIQRATVRFTLPGNLLQGERTIDVEVDDREVRPDPRPSNWW